MTVESQIRTMESKLQEAGETVGDLCLRADVARSTWVRWKNGQRQPNMGTWVKVIQAFDELVSSPTNNAGNVQKRGAA